MMIKSYLQPGQTKLNITGTNKVSGNTLDHWLRTLPQQVVAQPITRTLRLLQAHVDNTYAYVTFCNVKFLEPRCQIRLALGMHTRSPHTVQNAEHVTIAILQMNEGKGSKHECRECTGDSSTDRSRLRFAVMLERKSAVCCGQPLCLIPE